jgi:hypothetical protein
MRRVAVSENHDQFDCSYALETKALQRVHKRRGLPVRLIIPFAGGVDALDSRIIGIAEFLGVSCETLALSGAATTADVAGERDIHQDDCLVINARVVEAWCASNGLDSRAVSTLAMRYSQLLVYGLQASAFDNALVDALSGGRLQSIQAVNSGSPYVCSKDARAFCGSFAGLTFGRADSANDHVFVSESGDSGIEPLISIDGRPFVALVNENRTAMVLVAGQEIADLDMTIGSTPLSEYFSRFVPYAMALRYLAGDECWRPVQAHAAVIIDDPVLRTTYGFLNFESLLHLAERYNFHAAIAFIPHNFRKSSPDIVRLFLENPGRLSICFHGNDHTQAEFASPDRELLNLLLRVATTRMALHQKRTGLASDPVMVFPQGNFSVEAMEALRSHNFYAAVNTVPHPAHDPAVLTLRELAQPAVPRYGGFPLFLRSPVDKIRTEDIAFNVFFGRPVLIVEHHQDFEHEERLIALVEQINSTVPEIQWSSLATVTRQSMLRRRAPDGRQEIRAYAGTITIAADAGTGRDCSIEWSGSFDSGELAGVVAAGRPCRFERTGGSIRVAAELAAGQSMMLSLVHAASHPSSRTLDIRWKTKAFLRRRLSEFRDNYLYKNRRMLDVARAVQHRFSRA